MYRQTSLVHENTKQVKVSTSDMYQVYHRTVQIHHGTSFEKFHFHYWYKIFVFALFLMETPIPSKL